MDNIFLALFLLTPFVLIAGLLKPDIFNRLTKKTLTRKRIGLIFGGLTLLFFILFGVTTDTSSVPQVTTQNKAVSGLNDNNTVKQGNSETEAVITNISSQKSDTNEAKQVQTEVIKVIRVIDGDTIEIAGGQKIRYIGIDTPETVHPSEPVGCYGVEASNKNKELVLNKDVRVERDISETDQYGRLLRYVYVGDLMVNEHLVREGYANSSSYPPDIKYQNRFTEAERLARDEGKGLWSSFCDSWEYSSTNTTIQPSTTNGGTFVCDCSKTCSKTISSCAEAQYLLNVCGCAARDGDKDGIACDSSPLNCQN